MNDSHPQSEVTHHKARQAFTNVVAQTYGTALFELTEEAGTTAEVADELEQIAALLHAEPQLAALFDAKAISLAKRGETIRKLLEGRVSSHTLNFLLVLNEKDRLDQLTGAQYAYGQRIKQKRNQVDVELHAASALDAGQLSSVKDRISGAIGSEALIEQRVDPSLIGGLKIRIGDRLIDGSVASRLRRMRRQLIERGHELVRTGAGGLLSE